MMLRAPRRFVLIAALVLPACSAFYPRYTTVYRAVPPGVSEQGGLTAPPEEVQRIAVVSAEIPRQHREGRDWDSDGPPDAYVILYRNGAEVYRTRVIPNTLTPEWDPARDYIDLRVSDTDQLRFEMRDDDGFGSDLIGIAEERGVPIDARNGGNWTVRLEGGASVSLRSTPPPPQLGMGVTFDFENDNLGVLALEEAGPGYRAGLRVGDHITSIGGRAVGTLGEIGSRQAMDRNAMEPVELGVTRGAGHMTITVARDAVYPAH
jgi:hypothetical protein